MPSRVVLGVLVLSFGVVAVPLALPGSHVGLAQAGPQPDCTTVSGNLVSNCGFESRSIGVGNIVNEPVGFNAGGWVVAMTGLEIDGTNRLQANSGQQSIDLNPSSPGEIYQDIPTTAGNLYSLSFAVAGNPGSFPSECPRLSKR